VPGVGGGSPIWLRSSSALARSRARAASRAAAGSAGGSGAAGSGAAGGVAERDRPPRLPSAAAPAPTPAAIAAKAVNLAIRPTSRTFPRNSRERRYRPRAKPAHTRRERHGAARGRWYTLALAGARTGPHPHAAPRTPAAPHHSV